MRQRMLLMFTILLALACVVFAAVPGMASAIPSDTLTVYNASGAIFAQLTVLEGTEGNGTTPYVIPMLGLVKTSEFGNATTLCEALPCSASRPASNLSDVFGVIHINVGAGLQYYLGFFSDGENGTALGAQGANFVLETPNVPVSAIMYLDPYLVRKGYTVTFVSDGDMPEPASLVLLGTGLLGLAALSRRFLR